jgi:hypothetical protein
VGGALLRRAWREVEEAHFPREVELRKREQQQEGIGTHPKEIFSI